ncbi:unnamed protein product [Nesidiocoris tenuis]|uniref:C2H2-type domain-containing protein n=1 Tax=Nesidiocoris tenuis TaxID=355587 RepID=A0A6H5GZI1_9HEMI|nr:unnamed protein product [Nesidiocoris tenuis]
MGDELMEDDLIEEIEEIEGGDHESSEVETDKKNDRSSGNEVKSEPTTPKQKTPTVRLSGKKKKKKKLKKSKGKNAKPKKPKGVRKPRKSKSDDGANTSAEDGEREEKPSLEETGEKNLECTDCHKKFSKVDSLNFHIKRVHQTKKLQCYYCMFQTTFKFHMASHVKNKHLEPVPSKKVRDQPVTCCLCNDFSCLVRAEMIDHYIRVHGVEMQRYNLEFKSRGEFIAWKKLIEKKEVCRFTSQSGSTTTPNSRFQAFNCFRSGVYKARGVGKRRLKTVGSIKINSICPASIKIIEDRKTGIVRVTYVSTHVGHVGELNRVSLTREEREEISRKLAANVPADVVLDEIRNSIKDDKIERIHLLTNKDLINIRASFKLPSRKSLKTGKESVCIDSWVKAQGTNVVRLYKPLGSLLPEYPGLNKDDFMLILSNDTQLDLLRKHGSDTVCFDGTQGMNQYPIEMTTLLIIDNLGQGFPTAFMFCSRSDCQTMGVFVHVVQTALQTPLQTRVLMTDMSPIYYNGWCSVMPKPTHFALCTWHVDRAWQQNLTQIRVVEKRTRVYKALRALMEESDQNTFQMLLHNALTLFKSDDDLRGFGNYFETTFAVNVQAWALCYTKHFASASTSTAFELMHKTLKHIYMKGKKVEKLDNCILAVARFIRDKLYNQLTSCYRGTPPPKPPKDKKMSAIRRAHAKSLKMNDYIVSPSVDGWCISSSIGDEMHEVKRLDVQCEECKLRCSECNICVHAYQCTCSDSMVKNNICAHIHKALTSNRAQIVVTVCPTPSSAFDHDMHDDDHHHHDDDDVHDATGHIQPVDDVRTVTTVDTFHDVVMGDHIVPALSAPAATPVIDLQELKSEVMNDVLKILDEVKSVGHLKVLQEALRPVIPTIRAMNCAVPVESDCAYAYYWNC